MSKNKKTNNKRDRILEVIETSIVTLQREEKKVNDLNVFPVPDGDTGSNMVSTVLAAWKNISEDSETLLEILKDFSKGASLGGRGNSGVITSQIIKGLYEGVKKASKKTDNLMDKDAIKIILSTIRSYAYKSVFQPVEGTILSVVRELDENFNVQPKSKKDLLTRILKIANKAVERTPEQLEVLKEAGVVDSGAYGLSLLIKGIYNAVLGKGTKNALHLSDSLDEEFVKADKDNNIGYCTEFILTLREPEKFNEEEFKKVLIEDYKGDSLVWILEDDILKVHVHVKNPGDVFALAHKYGEFSKMKSENMATQAAQAGHYVETEKFEVKKKTSGELNEKELAIISVSNGKGLDDHLIKLGVDHIISGGQSMNPSVEDFVKLIKSIDYKNILLLPNNSNIILTAESAQKMIKNKNIFVLPTSTIPQGIVALYNINKEMINFNDFKDGIKEEFKSISEGQLTVAVRDTEMNNVEVKKDEFIALKGKEIIFSSKKIQDSLKALIDKIVIEDECDILTLIHNEDVSKSDLNRIEKYIKKISPESEIEFISGDQKVYHFLVFGEK